MGFNSDETILSFFDFNSKSGFKKEIVGNGQLTIRYSNMDGSISLEENKIFNLVINDGIASFKNKNNNEIGLLTMNKNGILKLKLLYSLEEEEKSKNLTASLNLSLNDINFSQIPVFLNVSTIGDNMLIDGNTPPIGFFKQCLQDGNVETLCPTVYNIYTKYEQLLSENENDIMNNSQQISKLLSIFSTIPLNDRLAIADSISLTIKLIDSIIKENA